MAVAFAEMHDTPVRMVAKGVLHGIVPWSEARPFLAGRLRRRWGSPAFSPLPVPAQQASVPACMVQLLFHSLFRTAASDLPGTISHIFTVGDLASQERLSSVCFPGVLCKTDTNTQQSHFQLWPRLSTSTPLAKPCTIFRLTGLGCQCCVYSRLCEKKVRCRLAEEEIIKHITTTDPDIGRSQALSLLRTWYLKTPIPKPSLASTSNRSAACLLVNPEQH